MNLSSLNNSYELLAPRKRLERLFDAYDEDSILVTSSFGSTSVVLLHMISQVKPNHPIHFVDTSYLFEETHEYKKQLIDRFDLNVISTSAPENQPGFMLFHQ
jgi:phosphoadenosine phosphosulfate reductase